MSVPELTPTEMAALHRRCFVAPRPWTAKAFASLLTQPGCVLCAHKQGFLLGRIAGLEAEILTLAVDPGSRRLGHGRALLDKFERSARARGATEAFLEVATDNAPAIALYQRAGYRETAVRRAYYHGPDGTWQDACVMKREFCAPPLA